MAERSLDIIELSYYALPGNDTLEKAPSLPSTLSLSAIIPAKNPDFKSVWFSCWEISLKLILYYGRHFQGIFSGCNGIPDQ